MASRLIFILTKNSAAWIAEVVRIFRPVGAAIIVLDNGSADDTAETARQAGAEALKFRHARPVGELLRRGFGYAKSAHPQAERFIVMDGRDRRNFSSRSFGGLEIRAPFRIWPAVLAEFCRAYIRPKHAIAFVRRGGPVLLAAVFAILLAIQINRSFDAVRPPIFRAGRSGTVAEERVAAMQWLKNHSPEDAIVMADQFDGNYVVALADRRVVSSSKVYPSEAEEVSARYTDIAKFFFSTDEDSALEIAAKYGADYVFVAYDFSYAKNCKLADSCHFIASGELTPIGKNRTLIGRMFARERLENFELLWDSPMFSIFRVLGGKTFRNPCRLTPEERSAALEIARGAPDTLGRRCSVAISAYRDGERFGPVIVGDEPLGRAIREAASRALAEAGQGARLEIAVWSDEEFVRRDIKGALDRPFDASKVLALERDGKRAVLLPGEFNLRRFASNAEVLDAVCGKSGFPADCWRKDAKIYAAPVDTFAEDGRGGVLTVSGTLPVPQDVIEFDDRIFGQRLTLARDWLWRMRTESGDFRNEIDPHNPSETPEDTRLASLRGAAETWWLLEFHRAVPDRPEVVPFGRAQSDRFERLIASGEEERTAFLIYAGLENLSLWRITGEARYLGRASRYADIARRLFVDEANLARSFRIKDGAPEVASSKSVGTIGNNSGLYFMAEVLAARENPELRAATLKFAEALRSNFRKNRILDPDISIVWESWLVNAFASVSLVSQRRSDAEFALEVANWILDYQSRDIFPHLRGAFKGRAATSGVGKITEALIEAAKLAPKVGEDPEPYLAGFREAMRWLMTAQYTETAYFLSDANRRAMSGALRSGLTDIKAEIDNAGHMVIAGAWYLSR